MLFNKIKIIFFYIIITTLIKAEDFNYSVYFNKSPYNDSLDTEFINYINQAVSRIDCSFYDINRDSIMNAWKAAADRGVSIRITSDVDTVDEVSAIDGYKGLITVHSGNPNGIMHNKYAVFDYNVDGSPVKNFVWTGSYNITDNGTLNNAQNVIIIKETQSSLASQYIEDFNQMFNNNLYGSSKALQNPKTLSIGSGTSNIRVMFSPKPDITQEIINAMNTADYSIYFCIFSFTESSIYSAMKTLKGNGVDIRGVYNAGAQGSFISDGTYTNDGFKWYKDAFSGLLHHKYMIIDAGHAASDPLVITGSHNWSGNADSANDENTLIIHSDEIAEKYINEFIDRYTEAGGTLLTISGISFIPSSIYDSFEETTKVYVNIIGASSTNGLKVYIENSSIRSNGKTYLKYYKTTNSTLQYTNSISLGSINYLGDISVLFKVSSGSLTNTNRANLEVKSHYPVLSEMKLSAPSIENDGLNKCYISTRVTLFSNRRLSSLSCNLSSIGAGTIELEDNGVNNDIEAGDSIYTSDNFITTTHTGTYTAIFHAIDSEAKSRTVYTNMITVSTDISPPSTISNILISSINNGIILSFTTSYTYDLQGVLIVRKTNSYPKTIYDGIISNIQSLPSTSLIWTNLDLTNGKRYYYSLFSYDEIPFYSIPAQVDSAPADLDNSELLIFNNLIDNNNPILELQCNNSTDNTGNIRIYDITGKLIFKDTLTYNQIFRWSLIDDKGNLIPPGTYIAVVMSTKFIKQKKFIFIR